MADTKDLLALMTRLRDPEFGCPWDIEQTFMTIAPYTLEEAYEVVEAIECEDYENLHEELGDLLFQVVFQAQMAKEAGHFDFETVIDGLVNKLLRRHPHVFPEGTLDSRKNSQTTLSTAQVTEQWQAIKQQEKRAEKDCRTETSSALPDSLPTMLPSLKKAEKIQKAAAHVGFDWDSSDDVVTKIKEELQEVSQALNNKEGKNRVAEEIGDLLFACVNYARHLDIDPEMALRAATKKFDSRFRDMETLVKNEGKVFKQLSLDEMENYWQQIKLYNMNRK